MVPLVWEDHDYHDSMVGQSQTFSHDGWCNSPLSICLRGLVMKSLEPNLKHRNAVGIETKQLVLTDKFGIDYFGKKALPWLRTYLQEKGIQSSSDGKNKRKAELAELGHNATAMKLPKVMDGDSEDRNTLLRVILSIPEGALPLPASILTWTHNFASMPEVTFPDICNFLLGKSDRHDKYSEGNLK